MSDTGAAELEIEVTSEADGSVVALSGELDISTAGELDAVLDSLDTSAPARVIFDMTGLRFMDSSGIGALVRAAGRFPAVSVVHLSDSVRRVLAATGLLEILHVVDPSRSRDFPPQAASVARARAFVVQSLVGRPTELVDKAELLVSELATNAVRHTGTEFTVRVVLTADRVRVEVTDRGEGQPTRRTPQPLEPSGRGIQIVEAMSDEWSVTPVTPRGKTVSFVLVQRGGATSAA